MKITNKEIVKIYPQLIKVRDSSSAKLPVKVAFALVRNIRNLEPIFTDATNLQLAEMQKYGKQQEDGSFFVEGTENVEAINKSLGELNNYENEVSIEKIALSALGDDTFTLEEMDALYIFIDDEN